MKCYNNNNTKCYHTSQWRPLQKLLVTKYSGCNLHIEKICGHQFWNSSKHLQISMTPAILTWHWLQLRLGKHYYMWTWIFQINLGEEWSQKLIESWNIKCIDVGVIMWSFDGKYGLAYKLTPGNWPKAGGLAFGVGWWLSALCTNLINLSASVYCMYFFNIVRHHIIFIFNTKQPTWSFLLSEVWLFLKPFTLKCMCILQTRTSGGAP